MASSVKDEQRKFKKLWNIPKKMYIYQIMGSNHKELKLSVPYAIYQSSLVGQTIHQGSLLGETIHQGSLVGEIIHP